MKSIIILCHRFLDQRTKQVAIGGVETYAANLVKLFVEEGFNVTVLQLGHSEEEFDNQEMRVHLIFCTSMKGIEEIYKKEFRKKFDATVLLSFEFGHLMEKGDKTIIVQHGVEFDGYTSTKNGFFLSRLQKLRLMLHMLEYKCKLSKMLRNSKYIVCVDLNFINFVRIFKRFSRYEEKLKYIPNFSGITSKKNLERKLSSERDTIKIIVPRRFEYHRGVMLYSEVADNIIRKYPHVKIDFIGDGTYNEYLQTKYLHSNQIAVYSVSHNELMDIYMDADICVIPTLYSEGTSLSAIEAMGNCCAVISSTVGGLGNLIFPDYNGIICEPTVSAFYDATCKLIENQILCKEFMKNGYNVAAASFSLEKWNKSWKEVLRSL